MRMRPIDIADALNSLAPNSVWTYENDDYESLEWHSDEVKKPTFSEVQAEIIRLEAEQELIAYRALRAAEYPDIKEYIDGVVKNDSDQIQTYIDKCLAVKAKYPKPGE